MAERKGTTSEKTYRSRNRALSALVKSDKNIVSTEKDFDSDIAINLIDSAYVLARAGDAGIDSAATFDLIDSAYILARAGGGTDSATVISLIEAARDSDRNAGTSTRVFRMDSIGALDVLSQHNGLGSEIGAAEVGDIAYIAGGAYRGDVYVLTNIAGPGAGYTNTGFRVQTNNGTVTRAFFDIVPSGQLPSENFAIGMSVARAAGGQDARTITAVSDTGAQYGGAPNLGYIDFTPSMAGYPPPFDNKYMYVNIAPLTTWHKLALDSAEITNIIDSAYVNARVSFDSDTVTQLVDSAYIQLRDRFQDSSGILAIVDSAYVQLRQSGGAITVQDEGSSLATSATTLNFTGSGVTASGTGATKTITISGGGGGGGGLDSAAVLALIDSNTRSFTYVFTASDGQTEFTGTDDNGGSLAYGVGNIITFLNGILLIDSADYTATNGSTITLNEAANTNDILTVTKFTSATSGSALSHTQYKFVATAPTTAFSGSDINGNSLSYDAGELQVHLNGILLIDSDDYTATNGTTVTLTSACDSDDILTVSVFTGGTSSGGGGSADSATILAVAGELKGNMFRINPQTLSINTTIDSAENAHCAGPISFDSGVTLTINGNLVIS